MRVSQAQQFVQLGSRILSTMVKFYMKFCARPAKVAKAGINCCWFGLSGNNRLTDLDTTQTALTLVMETKCPLTNTPPRLTWPNQTSVSLVRLLLVLSLHKQNFPSLPDAASLQLGHVFMFLTTTTQWNQPIIRLIDGRDNLSWFHVNIGPAYLVRRVWH